MEADISALKVKSGLGGTSVSFTDAANLIAASVATLPESISKSRISSMNQTDASDGAESIYRNGKVYTGYYKKFQGSPPPTPARPASSRPVIGKLAPAHAHRAHSTRILMPPSFVAQQCSMLCNLATLQVAASSPLTSGKRRSHRTISLSRSPVRR